MIVKENFISPNATEPLIKIYSDSGFFLQNNGQIYEEVIVPNEESIKNYSETSVAIPAMIADEHYIYQTIMGEYTNITKEEILGVKNILLKALRSLVDEEAYQVKIFFNNWEPGIQYEVNNRVWYNGELYTVIKTPNNDVTPDLNTECYIKTQKPLDLVDEWNSERKKKYMIGEQTKVGEHYYESLLDNNLWSPQDFPSAWKLIK